MRDQIPTEPHKLVAAIRIRDLHAGFGATEVLSGLDLTVPRGAWTCLLGTSGVGKTTLLRLIAGLVPYETGEITTTGPVAYMAQQDLLMPWLTAQENVMLGARLRGELPDRVKARDLLHRVGLAPEAARRPAALSGGQRQRVALARTLMEDRPIILMDEPFSALDAITRLRLQDLAAELLADRTIVLITHDPLEALRLGHHIHVLRGQPAALTQAIEPSGATPRDPTTPNIARLHRQLLDLLTGKPAAAIEGAA